MAILKITKDQFIDAVTDNIDGLTVPELAKQLGISAANFYRLQNKYKVADKEHLKAIVQRYTAEQVANLRRNAQKGDTKASAILLDIGEVYDPRKKASTQGQLQVNFFITGLDVPKDAGLSTAIPERAGTPVELPADAIKIVKDPQPGIKEENEENW